MMILSLYYFITFNVIYLGKPRVSMPRNDGSNDVRAFRGRRNTGPHSHVHQQWLNIVDLRLQPPPPLPSILASVPGPKNGKKYVL